MGLDKEVLDQFAASIKAQYSGLPIGYVEFVANETQSDGGKAEQYFLKTITNDNSVSKVEGKKPVSKISVVDADRINKFYDGERKQNFKKDLKSGTPNTNELDDLVSKLGIAESEDDLLEGIKKSSNTFEGFLKQISKVEFTPKVSYKKKIQICT